jgi:hypothetical protein
MKKLSLLLLLISLLPVASATAQPADVVTVGSGSTGPAGTIDIPVYIRDVSGTPLGMDQPPGSKIQSYSIKVDYSPASAVASVTFTRGGITTTLTPTFESSPSSPGSISLIDTFAENTNPIPFTLNAPAPGNQVGVLHFNLSGGGLPGSSITLAIDPVLTQLTDQAGSGATKETVAAGNLAVVAGAINIGAAPGAPALSTWALIALAMSLAFVAVRMRF